MDIARTKAAPPMIYTVKQKDTMLNIAMRFYGDPNRWIEIADANGILSPRSLRQGLQIKIPNQ